MLSQNYKIFIIAICLSFFTPIFAEDKASRSMSQSSLTVHEWGTFTTVAGINGKAQLWRPLANAKYDLPGFVYQSSKWEYESGIRTRRYGKRSFSAAVRMETPVIYFYTDKEMEVEIKVNFPQGGITEWYPHARGLNTSINGQQHHIGFFQGVDSGIDWGKIKILPKAKVSFPIEKGKSHYYPARETDAAPVRVCGANGIEHEKFLFYRGIGNFQVPLTVNLVDNQLHIKNIGTNNIPSIIVFERQGDKVQYDIHGTLGQSMVVNRPQQEGSLDDLLQKMEDILVDQGLYQKEAKAMVKTWRDTWFIEGLRVFYIFPTELTNAILPLTIKPTPGEMVRILVGNMEVITPEAKEEVMDLLANEKDLAKVAKQVIDKYGRFAEPILKTMANDKLVAELLRKMVN